jgi:hypothetical protein
MWGDLFRQLLCWRLHLGLALYYELVYLIMVAADGRGTRLLTHPLNPDYHGSLSQTACRSVTGYVSGSTWNVSISTHAKPITDSEMAAFVQLFVVGEPNTAGTSTTSNIWLATSAMTAPQTQVGSWVKLITSSTGTLWKVSAPA